MNNKETINILKRGYPDSNRYAASESEVYEYDVETYNEAVEYAIKALEEKIWIPVSERLPDKSGRYLITIREGIWTYKKRKIDTFDFETDNCEEMIRSVIAWQPLPEPYKEGDKE